MESFGLLLFLTFICCTTSISELAEWNVEDEQKLIQAKFLTDAAASTSLVIVRPPGPNGTNLGLEVELSYDQITIQEVDERNGYITMSMLEQLSWNDSRLAWNQTKYSGVEKITILPKYIWLPDVSYYSPTLGSVVAKDDHHNAGTKAIISSDGSIFYATKRTAQFHCNMDVTFFPFDNQTCTLLIATWVHNQAEMKLLLTHEGDVHSSFNTQHTEWTLNSTTINSHTDKFPCCPEPYQMVELTVMLERRSEFFYYIFLVPSATINFALPVLHFFPPTSSQKTIIAGLLLICSMILHLMLYQQLRGFADEKPPILVEVFDAQLTMIVVSIAVSSITSSLANITHTTWRVPLLLRKIVNTVIGRLCCFGKADIRTEFTRLDELNKNIRFDPNGDSTPMVSTAASDEQHIEDKLEISFQQLIGELRIARERRQLEREWYQIALIIDRFTGIIYVIYTIVMFIQYRAVIRN